MADRYDLGRWADEGRHVAALGDVTLAPPDLKELCAALARRGTLAAHRPEVEAALAIAAVNALPEQPDDRGFRAHFCDLLDLDVAEWDRWVGPAIERFCVRTFGDEPRDGPYRYVGMVWRHAGLRSGDVPRLAGWLREQAMGTGGWAGLAAHPERLRDALQDATWHSPYLDRFMQQNGASLCQHVVLLWVRLAEGLAGPSDIETAGRRAAALIAALQSQERSGPHTPKGRGTGQEPATLPDPVMVLRWDIGALDLCFDPDGVAAGAYDCREWGPVTTPTVRLDSPLPWYSGGAGLGPSRRPWGLVGWRRGRETQCFRLADGRRLSGETPERRPRQECWAVSTEPVPAGLTVLERLGGFALGPSPVHLLRVRAAEAPGPAASPPELIWEAGASRHLQGACAGAMAVWSGPPPRLRVDPPEAAALWRVLGEWGGQRQRLGTQADGTVELPVPEAVPVTVWLEPIREQRRGSSDPTPQRSAFVCLPPVSVRLPQRLLAAGEPCRFTCEGAVEWRWPEATPLGGSAYELPPGLRLLEGSVTAGSLRVPVVRLVPRAGLQPEGEAPPEDGGVWWLDGWEGHLLLAGWPEQEVSCRLCCPTGEARAQDLRLRFDLGGQARLSRTAWAERLALGPPLATVEVRGPGGWAGTGRWIGLAGRVPGWLETQRAAPWAPALPERIRTWLAVARDLVAGRVPPDRWPALAAVPAPLQPWVRRLAEQAVQAQLAAGRELPRAAEPWAPEAQRPSVRAAADRARLARWTEWVRAHYRDGHDPAPGLPFPRWLTQAACAYLDAGGDRGDSLRSRHLLDDVVLRLRGDLPADAEGVVRTAAFVLAALALWHRQGREELRRAAADLAEGFGQPAVPPAVARLCALPLPETPIAWRDLPVWPGDEAATAAGGP